MPTNLVTIDEIKEYVDIADTLERTYIDKYIQEAQRNYLRGLLGEGLYNQVIAGYPDNLSYADIALLPFIRPCLAYRFYQLYLIREGIYNMPSGMRVYSDDNSTPVSDARRGMLIDNAKSNAVANELDLQTFLIQNKEDYPLWNQGCNQVQVKKKASISAVKQNRRRSNKDLGTGKTWRRNP